VSALSALAALPIALWEFSLGVWLIVKGFRPSPITAGMPAAARRTNTTTPSSNHIAVGDSAL
jgi:hypothetical protein